MIRIAIDGPGGSGKSSVAKSIARELGIIYVDTGALYRNIGLYMLDSGINPKDTDAVGAALSDITIELKFENGKQVILLNGIDRGDDIRTPTASMAASDVSAIPAVREYLLNMQRDTARKNSVVMDGRDIGTVILPNAEVKIFLTASPEARARRRHAELLSRGSNVSYEQVYSEMVERDKNDSTRAIAPCVPADDAVFLDNSNMTERQTLDKILEIVAEKSKQNPNFYSKAKAIVAPIFCFFMRVKAKGLENVPKEGGIVLCSNHLAAVDVISIGAVCPRQLTCVAKKELFSIPVLGWVMRKLEAIKIDRGGSDVGALKASIKAAEAGRVLTIFPQGHRCPGVNPATTPIKHGAGMIAYHAKCDVVPVCINIKGARYGIFKKVEVIFGKPIGYSKLGFKEGGRDEYLVATEKIFAEICKLGDYSSLPDYDPTKDKIKKKKRPRK